MYKIFYMAMVLKYRRDFKCSPEQRGNGALTGAASEKIWDSGEDQAIEYYQEVTNS